MVKRNMSKETYKVGDVVGSYFIQDKIKTGREYHYILKCNKCDSIIEVSRNTLLSYRKNNECCCKQKIVVAVGKTYGLYCVKEIRKDNSHVFVYFQCTKCGHVRCLKKGDFIKLYKEQKECDCSYKHYKTEIVHGNIDDYLKDKALKKYNNAIGSVLGDWKVKELECPTSNVKGRTKKRTDYKFKCECIKCGRERTFQSCLLCGNEDRIPICVCVNDNVRDVLCKERGERTRNKWIDKYNSYIGKTIGDWYILDFFYYQYKVHRYLRNEYKFKCLCIKCGFIKGIRCSILLKSYNKIKHKCVKHLYKNVACNKKIEKKCTEKEKIKRDSIADNNLSLEAYNDVIYNSLSEYSYLYGSQSFMETFAQASLDGTIKNMNDIYAIEDLYDVDKYKESKKSRYYSFCMEHPDYKKVWYNENGSKRIRGFKKWKHGKRSKKND